ncbi:MAG: DNA repair exonuclease [Candidatus Aenigmarchaeota archaeon]|nr:DNA repair exonuclease [Candidatus Aenigmarchaeota archaeon]
MTVKIAIISDTHFGVSRGTEREEDCWENAREAFEKAKDCDLIILPGDLFDGRIPRPEDWAKSMEILSGVNVPVVAIHGNHERRGKEMINPVEGLERAKFLKYIHCNSVTLDVKGVKISIYGIGWVPESYAKEVLRHCNPKPIDGSYNILVMHQSISPYVFNPLDPPSIRLEDLPPGFDLYVNGHIHWPVKTEVHGKPFLIPGSTVTTQVNKSESKNPKGFYIVEIGEKVDIKFVKLENARKVYYQEFEISEKDKLSEVMEKIENYLNGINDEKKPLVRVILKGKVKSGMDIDRSKIKKKYRDRLILSIGLKVIEGEVQKKIKLLRDLKEKKVSIDEMGMNILRENMKELDIPPLYENIFDFLVDGNIDSAITYLLSNSENASLRSTGIKKWL